YEITRRHETGFSSIGANNFDLVPFNTGTDIGRVGVGVPGAFPLPFGTVQVTVPQQTFLEGLTAPQLGAYAPALPGFVALLGPCWGVAVNGARPAGLAGTPGFFSTCQAPGSCFFPASFQSLSSQEGNFPVFEATSLSSLRLAHNL